MLQIYLKKKRDKPVRDGHPWLFSGAIDRLEGEAAPGEPCTVHAASGEFLAHGYCNPTSSIAVRLWGKGEWSAAVFSARLEAAIARRGPIQTEHSDVCRLVNSEGDFLPGLIVDRYGPGLCIQILTAGMERYRELTVQTLRRLLNPLFIYERSDAEARREEQLPPLRQCVWGALPGELVVRENGYRFRVDLAGGQKTGFFIDQRANRELVGKYAAGRVVCDCCAYTGGFSVYAWGGGARELFSVDISGPALELARDNLQRNGPPPHQDPCIKADVFEFLRRTGQLFDLIILDPPKFARHRKDVPTAARGYKDINLLALKRLAPGGLLFTFSCSQAIDTRLFRQILFAAATDSGRRVQVLQPLSQGVDHPVDIAHLEGEYLKGLLLRVA